MSFWPWYMGCNACTSISTCVVKATNGLWVFPTLVFASSWGINAKCWRFKCVLVGEDERLCMLDHIFPRRASLVHASVCSWSCVQSGQIPFNDSKAAFFWRIAAEGKDEKAIALLVHLEAQSTHRLSIITCTPESTRDCRLQHQGCRCGISSIISLCHICIYCSMLS